MLFVFFLLLFFVFVILFFQFNTIPYSAQAWISSERLSSGRPGTSPVCYSPPYHSTTYGRDYVVHFDETWFWCCFLPKKFFRFQSSQLYNTKPRALDRTVKRTTAVVARLPCRTPIMNWIAPLFGAKKRMNISVNWLIRLQMCVDMRRYRLSWPPIFCCYQCT